MYHQGKQFIPNVTTVEVPGIFRGRPIISNVKINEDELVNICPLHAITKNPVSIDLGKCTFCGECAFAFPDKIKFTKVVESIIAEERAKHHKILADKLNDALSTIVRNNGSNDSTFISCAIFKS